jgi:hypothetical protein
MKSCPTCNRTFEDTLTYCLVDGSILSAPFDPQATLIITEARKTNPPPTEILPSSLSPPLLEVSPARLKPKRLWLRVVLAIIIALVISWAIGFATYGLSNILVWQDVASAGATGVTIFFITLAILVMLIFRWWRRKRREA